MSEATATPRPSSGGTGFLFGNIDSRGRLDEDYMDEDAKDQLDNVAPTVAERDPNLREITAAVPRGGAAGGQPDAEAEERGSPTEHADAAEDYYDETEVMEDLEPAEREALASRALAEAARQRGVPGAPAAASDDENYDDDDDEAGDGAGVGGAPAASSVPATTPVVGATPGALPSAPEPSPLPSPSPSPAPLPPPSRPTAPALKVVETPRPGAPAPPPLVRFSASEAAAAKATDDKPIEGGMTAEERMQVELMEAARKKAALQKAGESEFFPFGTKPEASLASVGRLRFSEVLALPPKRLPSVAKRKRYGVKRLDSGYDLRVDGVPAVPAAGNEFKPPQAVCALDDADLLNRPVPPRRVDPVSLFLKSDVEYREQRATEDGPLGFSDTIECEAVKSGSGHSDEEDDEDACRPLVEEDEAVEKSAKIPGRNLNSADFSVLQQTSWEADIKWEQPGDSDGYNTDEDIDATMDVDGGKHVVEHAGKQDVPGDDDEDDEDEMEWEEGNVTSHPVESSAETAVQTPTPAPATPAASPEPSPSASKPPLAPLAASKPTPSAVVKVSKEEKPSPEKVGTKNSVSVVFPIVEGGVSDPLICTMLQPNRSLAECEWVQDIAWDSSDVDSDVSLAGQAESRKICQGRLRNRPRREDSMTNRLILDMNDRSLILEEVTSSEDRLIMHPQVAKPMTMPVADADADGASVRAELARMALLDPFNVSNDAYYARGVGNSMLKLGRREILRGLRNAPPAIKAQTTVPCPLEDYLDNFHRPRFSAAYLSRKQFELQPFRRKRPKGGSSQIAGQVPKKQGELLVSAKDAYRVCLFEFALEAAPSLIAIPGMASKVVTYDRKVSAAAAGQARKDATGTPDADTVFLSPEEMPPLHAGDLAPDEKPLNVLESHLFSAPCTRHEAASTDFLVVRRKDKMYVREIDSVLSVGVTEPKVEVMAPNSDRFKKYSRDRVSLWLLRELLKNLKNPKNSDGSASIERDHLFGTFPRRRSFPETSLGKLLKELSKYHNGKYVLIPEPPKGFAAMEAEWLRTVSPEETCAFEAMDSGWHRLIKVGIQKLTHPNHTGIRAAAEKTGLAAGPAVGAFIWNQLLRVPWHRSQIMIAAQKQQRKEMIQALATARIVNDLREGGSVMERRVASLTSAEAANVLVNQYRVQTRKIPQDLEARRSLVQELALKKSKGMDRENYQEVIAAIIQKQRSVGGNRTAAGAGVTAAVVAGGVMIIPLEDQRSALELGDVTLLPREESRIASNDDPALAARLEASVEEIFGKGGIPETGSKQKTVDPVPSKTKNDLAAKSAHGKKKKKQLPKSQKQLEAEEDEAELKKMMKASSAMKTTDSGPSPKPVPDSGPVQAPLDATTPKKKKVKRVKVTRRVTGEDGVKRDEIVYVTDPAEIERLVAKNRAASKAKAVAAEGKAGKPEESSAPGASSSKLKIAINVRKLSQGAKATGTKSKGAVAGGEKKRSSGQESKKGHAVSGPAGSSSSLAFGATGSEPRGKGIETVVEKKGHVGKIKINQKVVRQAQEAQAAKRKRSQYGEDLEYPVRKLAKKSSTSRRKRNGWVILNGILEQVEKTVRETEGYVDSVFPVIHVVRLRAGERVPEGREAKNLARPSNTSLDFTKAVDTKTTPTYKDFVKKQMYLDLIKHKCKQMKYQSSAEFLEDFLLMVNNAKAFNHTADVQWVVQHAELLYDVAKEEVQSRMEEISAAELQVKKEKQESAANLLNGNRSAETGKKASKKSGAKESSKDGETKNISSKDVKPKDSKTKGGKMKDGKAKDGKSKDGKVKDVIIKDGNAKEGKPKERKPSAISEEREASGFQSNANGSSSVVVPLSVPLSRAIETDNAPFPGGVFGDSEAPLALTDLGGDAEDDEDEALALDIAAEINADPMFQ